MSRDNVIAAVGALVVDRGQGERTSHRALETNGSARPWPSVQLAVTPWSSLGDGVTSLITPAVTCAADLNQFAPVEGLDP